MQQSYAKLCGVTKPSRGRSGGGQPALEPGAFVRHGVTLRREFNEVPPITVESTRSCRFW